MMATVTGFASRHLLVLSLTAMAACGSEPTAPEQEVRAWIDAMHAAVEAKNRGELIDRISPSYVDARGNGRDDVENLLRVYFLRQDEIAVVPSIGDITIIGDTAAEVTLTVAMAGTNSGRLGISADAYRFELELEASGDDWLLISARWGELGQQLR